MFVNIYLAFFQVFLTITKQNQAYGYSVSILEGCKAETMTTLMYVYVNLLVYGGINSYFGPLVLWQILSTNNNTTSTNIIQANEVQKLDRPIFGSSLFTKMIAYTTSYATTSLVQPLQPSGIDGEKVGSQEVAIFGQTATNFVKIVSAQRFHVPFCPKMSPKWKKTAKTAQNEA